MEKTFIVRDDLNHCARYNLYFTQYSLFMVKSGQFVTIYDLAANDC